MIVVVMSLLVHDSMYYFSGLPKIETMDMKYNPDSCICFKSFNSKLSSILSIYQCRQYASIIVALPETKMGKAWLSYSAYKSQHTLH